ncbi:hypothetical protein J7624_01415 [Wohlfahrtiimonas chitiniclastica]|uniref:hypothetical protein n=1 Tax=Wohlfahrtiimonas chitiniclastica TaxID=400946 RepID=UPI000B98203A|nr:hypothetical protein [Wohlfahrtiimonas chitiniclastica]MBS7817838.1 hypothetical protein [Wohlfahrtiimonas chitiniclastica]MBS7825805.1 hypothetical protein [Wohlfahrtiimonas chitiniclastica]OYQ76359.1 hypothetical protein B9T18_03090 [Wohlfahrtiimonas chitiniclastica]
MKKLPLTNPATKTKYSDLAGAIEIDWEGRISSLVALCREKGINMDQYYLIGFGFVSFEADYVTCKAVLLDSTKYGQTFEEVEESVAKLRSVNAVQKNFQIPYAELEKYIKHINALVFTDIGLAIDEITIKENLADYHYDSDDLPQYS